MSSRRVAIVVGVGAEAGLGGALCKRFGREGLHVLVAGRTAARLEALAGAIRDAGGEATAVPGDTTVEADVVRLFDAAGEPRRSSCSTPATTGRPSSRSRRPRPG